MKRQPRRHYKKVYLYEVYYSYWYYGMEATEYDVECFESLEEAKKFAESCQDFYFHPLSIYKFEVTPIDTCDGSIEFRRRTTRTEYCWYSKSGFAGTWYKHRMTKYERSMFNDDSISEGYLDEAIVARLLQVLPVKNS